LGAAAVHVRATVRVATGFPGCVVGSVTTIVALEEEVALDDTVATYEPALPYVCEMANAVD